MHNSKHHHKGKYIPINKNKYIGDISKITIRSSWERGVCIWADKNPDIQYWSSESVKVNYKCSTDGEMHQYIIDFTLKYTDGTILLVEVKPFQQTIKPKITKGKRKSTILTEQLAFMKNVSKWTAADEFAKKNNCKFVIWTENKLRAIGVPII